MTLTRRERAMYVTLLHALRGMVFEDDPVDAFHVRASFGVYACGSMLDVYDARVRARLCLFLRAVLRADAGDFGKERRTAFRCSVCRGEQSRASWSCVCGAPTPYNTVHRERVRITPLWQLAPKTRAR
jgi:hypothetical protein